MAGHGIGVALGIDVLTVGQRGLGDQGAEPGVVGLFGKERQLLVGDGQFLAECADSGRHLREATFDQGPGHARASLERPPPGPSVHSVPGPLPTAFVTLLSVTLLVGCGDGSGDDACGTALRERLDPSSGVHILPGAPEPDYLSDPPTSGIHRTGPPPRGVLDEPLDPPLQVGALEQGVVLVQHRDLDADERRTLEELAGGNVVVAPNPDLPSRVVFTAWTAKQQCRAVDPDALAQFVANAPPVRSDQ